MLGHKWKFSHKREQKVSFWKISWQLICFPKQMFTFFCLGDFWDRIKGCLMKSITKDLHYIGCKKKKATAKMLNFLNSNRHSAKKTNFIPWCKFPLCLILLFFFPLYAIWCNNSSKYLFTFCYGTWFPQRDKWIVSFLVKTISRDLEIPRMPDYVMYQATLSSSMVN